MKTLKQLQDLEANARIHWTTDERQFYKDQLEKFVKLRFETIIYSQECNA